MLMSERRTRWTAFASGGSDLVTMGRAAAHAEVSRRTVRRWVLEGLLAVHHPTGRWAPRVRLSDVERLTAPARLGHDEADEQLWSGSTELLTGTA